MVKDETVFVAFLNALLESGSNIARAARIIHVDRVTVFRWIADSEQNPAAYTFEFDSVTQALHLHVKSLRKLARIVHDYDVPEIPPVAVSVGELMRGPNFNKRPPDKRAREYVEKHTDDQLAEMFPMKSPTRPWAKPLAAEDAELLGEPLADAMDAAPPEAPPNPGWFQPKPKAPLPEVIDVVDVAPPEPEPEDEEPAPLPERLPVPAAAMSSRAAQAAAHRCRIEARVASGGSPMTDMESRLLAELEEPTAARQPGGPMPEPPRVKPIVRHESDDDRREKITGRDVDARVGGVKIC